MTKMIIARADDWEGIYIEERLMAENHNIDLIEAVNLAIEHEVDEVESKWVNLDWIGHVGHLPDDIKEVLWEDDEYEMEDQSETPDLMIE